MFKRLYYIILQRIYVLKNKNKTNQGRVYMFHEVSDNNGTYSISKEHFKEFLDWLYISKKIVDPKTLLKEKNLNNVVITFDDAFDSIYKNAYPLLKEKNVPFVIFECLDFLNKKDFLSEEMIKDMLENSKCILGSHSIKHELHRFLKEDVANNYIEESRKELEKKFNTKVNCFAFPYGSMYACSNENIDKAKQIYDYVFMTYPLSYNEENKNVIPRINMNDKTYIEEMK